MARARTTMTKRWRVMLNGLGRAMNAKAQSKRDKDENRAARIRIASNPNVRLKLFSKGRLVGHKRDGRWFMT